MQSASTLKFYHSASIWARAKPELHMRCYITFTLRRRNKYKALVIIPSSGIKTNKAIIAYPKQSVWHSEIGSRLNEDKY